MRIKNDNYFETINTENKAYLLGFIAADGYVCTKSGNKNLTISLSDKDVEILNFAKTEFEYDGKFRKRYIGLNSYLTLRIYGKQFVDNIIKYGFDNTKTYRFHLPTIPISLYKHFIRGYFDGDGCIYFSKKKQYNAYKYSISIIGTESFCKEINQFVLETLKFSFKEILVPTLNNKNIITLKSENISDIKTFLHFIYDGCSFCLNRKYKKYKELLKIHDNHNQERRRKFTTEQIKDIKHRLISGETSRHIAKDYNVTHGAIGGIKSGKSYSYINI